MFTTALASLIGEEQIMISKHVRYGFSLRLAVLAVVTLCLTQFNLRAQELELRVVAAAASGDGIPLESISMNYGKVSFGYGQTLRLNLTYAVAPTQAGQSVPAIRAKAQFKDTSGNTIYVSSANGGVWKTVDGGQSWSFEVNRDQLSLAGDPRTGAVALVPELVIEAPAGAGTDFPTSLELTDNLTGKVVFHDGRFVARQQPTTASGTFTLTFNGQTTATRGETLQVNLTNPLLLTVANQAVAASDYFITIKDIKGEASYVRRGTVNPGQTIVAEFNRDQLPAAGDPGTGRLSLATEIRYSLRLTPEQLAALGELPQFSVSFEIVDNATGRTTTRSIGL
jgi:hypothetical protein